MPRANEQKIKLLVLYDILQRETDEEHPLSTNEIIERLSARGIEVSRKILPGDIELLNKYGFEILSYKKKSHYYYVAYRPFDIAELKVLIDAVQAATFISESKTEGLVNRLASMAGEKQAEKLKQNFICYDTVKKDSKYIFYYIDEIERAIEQGNKISFCYCYLTYKAERKYRKDGQKYIVNPLALVYSRENYYVVCYDNNHKGCANYRIDRIADLRIEPERIDQRADFENFNINTYRRQAFSMYNGELTEVQLTVHEDLIEEIFDKFGEKTKLCPQGEEYYTTVVSVQVSPAFFRWVIGSIGKIKIYSPRQIKEQFDAYVDKVKENY